MSITFQRSAATEHPVTVSTASVTSTFAPEATGTPALEEQREQAGALLGQLYDYLETNAVLHAGLASAIDRLSSAVAEFRARRSSDPFSGVRDVFAAIQAARAADAAIPEP
jgi:hypothetical protein